MKAYPTNNEKYADYQGKILLSTERVKGLIREEVDKVLNEAEITPLYLLEKEKMKSVVDDDGSQDKDKIQAIKTLMQISGMMETEKKNRVVNIISRIYKGSIKCYPRRRFKKTH